MKPLALQFIFYSVQVHSNLNVLNVFLRKANVLCIVAVHVDLEYTCCNTMISVIVLFPSSHLAKSDMMRMTRSQECNIPIGDINASLSRTYVSL